MQRKLNNDATEQLLAAGTHGLSTDPRIKKMMQEGKEEFKTDKEQVEVDTWLQQDAVVEFDDSTSEFNDANNLNELDFMCQEPQVCNSFKRYGSCCKCIRTNFSCPSEFNYWRKSYINLAKDLFLDEIEKYKEE